MKTVQFRFCSLLIPFHFIVSHFSLIIKIIINNKEKRKEEKEKENNQYWLNEIMKVSVKSIKIVSQSNTWFSSTIFSRQRVWKPTLQKLVYYFRRFTTKNVLGGNNMFMPKKEKLAKYNALAKEYRETVKKLWKSKRRRAKNSLGAIKWKRSSFLTKWRKLSFNTAKRTCQRREVKP